MTATRSLPAQPDLSRLVLPRGSRKASRLLITAKKEVFKKIPKSSCYFNFWTPLSATLWSSPAFPPLEGALGGQAPGEKLLREEEGKIRHDLYMHAGKNERNLLCNSVENKVAPSPS